MAYDPVTKTEISRLLYMRRDSDIAQYLKTSIERVRKVRREAPDRLKGGKKIRDSALIDDDPARTFQAVLYETLGRQCDALLKRQLETGQCHYDVKTRIEILRRKGWLE